MKKTTIIIIIITMTITMMILIVNFMEENIFIEENRQDYGSGKEDPSSYQNGPEPNPFAPIVINGKAIEVVSTVKLLGLNISSDLRRNVMLLK